MKVKIRLKTIDDVHNFSRMCESYDINVDAKSGRTVVDAKSVIGLMTLNLHEPIELEIYGGTSEVYKSFTEELKTNGYFGAEKCK